jgi:hypothetical protein
MSDPVMDAYWAKVNAANPEPEKEAPAAPAPRRSAGAPGCAHSSISEERKAFVPGTFGDTTYYDVVCQACRGVVAKLTMEEFFTKIAIFDDAWGTAYGVSAGEISESVWASEKIYRNVSR